MPMEESFFIFFIFFLLVVGVLSFALFIRRLLINFQVKNNQLNEINRNLERMIELLEDKTD
ncbi:DUF4083 family protein [Heyndrickxia vini]|uniref:DUF4083 family protein n=2 Tax=Bacillaceae TaxID=186817 RepID=A0ABX7E682_9BACI|nr:DUF4083 family protein [Heyndrickxia vini]